jgi:hypothetical protein
LSPRYSRHELTILFYLRLNDVLAQFARLARERASES